MGNLHSSWLRRQRDDEHEAQSTEQQPQDSETSSSPYGLRRTVARIRRRVHRGTIFCRVFILKGPRPLATDNDSLNLAHLPFPDGSTNSLNSVGSRRRTREPDDASGTDVPIQNDSQRPRLEALTREVFTPDPEDQAGTSMFFYFSLPGEMEERSGEVGGTDSPPSSPSSSSTTPERRRSTRLQQAAEYFRERFGRTLPRDNPIEAPVGPSQQLVLVRIRQLPIQEGIANGDDNVRSVFQWTIYFVLPQGTEAAANSVPPSAPFDAGMAVQRAFAVLRAMMSGENMTFEDWTRLQEMMGFVSRGVSKEQVEEQCAAIPFSIHTNIGISCPICLADYQNEELVRTLPCAHSYHTECIDTWLSACNNCPLCRQPPVSIQ
ncbi:hypothetical protein PSACC_00049 [Paramicrosporidium saccamoebae]|uniref:RING-type E3 ubiquitin transferase n=1 Tax=Paramicrosporidium saccamoebae TaxID=1246581 RepID=A0A2H9TQY3_9FUNG|nr:hypothetical protein PSACC_00049 [Paramicrosporidium saccamoebae]